MIQKNVQAHIQHRGTLLGPKPVIKISRSKRVASENDTQIRVFVISLYAFEQNLRKNSQKTDLIFWFVTESKNAVSSELHMKIITN